MQALENGIADELNERTGSDFAARVMDAARSSGPDDRFGAKVFLSAIRSRLSMDRPEFDRAILAARTDGTLDLSRADLVGAMDRARVAASEVGDGRSEYHFVRL